MSQALEAEKDNWRLTGYRETVDAIFGRGILLSQHSHGSRRGLSAAAQIREEKGDAAQKGNNELPPLLFAQRVRTMLKQLLPSNPSSASQKSAECCDQRDN